MSINDPHKLAPQRTGTSQRGGARPGTGPKPRYINSSPFAKTLWEEAQRRAADGEGNIADIALDMAMGRGEFAKLSKSERHRIQMAMVKEVMARLDGIREATELEEGENMPPPPVILPAKIPDPSKVVPIERKPEE